MQSVVYRNKGRFGKWPRKGPFDVAIRDSMAIRVRENQRSARPRDVRLDGDANYEANDGLQNAHCA